MSRASGTVMGVAAGVATFILLENVERLRDEWAPIATWITGSWQDIVADPSVLLRQTASPTPAPWSQVPLEGEAHQRSTATGGASVELPPRTPASTPDPAGLVVDPPLVEATPSVVVAEGTLPVASPAMESPAPTPQDAPPSHLASASQAADLSAATDRARRLAASMERLGRRLEGRRDDGAQR